MKRLVFIMVIMVANLMIIGCGNDSSLTAPQTTQIPVETTSETLPTITEDSSTAEIPVDKSGDDGDDSGSEGNKGGEHDPPPTNEIETENKTLTEVMNIFRT